MDAGHPPPHRPPSNASRSRWRKIREVWPLLAHTDRIQGFLLLPRDEAEDFFFCRVGARSGRAGLRHAGARAAVLGAPLAAGRRGRPDPGGAAEKREALLALLDEPTRREVTALLAYAEDDAGGLMNPRYIRAAAGMTVDEAIGYVRKQMREQPRTIYYGYVLTTSSTSSAWCLSASCSPPPSARGCAEIMKRQVTTIPEQMDQEAVSHMFAQSHLVALPVVDRRRADEGIVTVDDIVDVVQEEATEDMQKVGGVEALDEPYLQSRCADDPQTRRLAVGAVHRRDADRQRDGLLREGDCPRGGAGAVHPADHLERRQLRLAGDHAGHPGDGARRSSPPRLVAGHPARGRRRARPGLRAGGRSAFFAS